MDALLAANEFDVPAAMVSQEAQALKQQTQQEMAQAGQQSTVDLPVSVFEPQAERRVKLGLLVGELIRRHEMDVDQARVDEVIAEQAATYEDPNEIINWYKENPQARSSVENVVMEDQVVDLILEQAKVEDENLSFDELLNNNQG